MREGKAILLAWGLQSALTRHCWCPPSPCSAGLARGGVELGRTGVQQWAGKWDVRGDCSTAKEFLHRCRAAEMQLEMGFGLNLSPSDSQEGSCEFPFEFPGDCSFPCPAWSYLQVTAGSPPSFTPAFGGFCGSQGCALLSSPAQQALGSGVCRAKYNIAAFPP